MQVSTIHTALAMALFVFSSAAHAYPTATREVLVDNDHVCVIRITIPPWGSYQPDRDRVERVIVHVTGNQSERHAMKLDGSATLPADQGEQITRNPGDAEYRTASRHSIRNLTKDPQVSDIIELRPCPPPPVEQK